MGYVNSLDLNGGMEYWTELLERRGGMTFTHAHEGHELCSSSVDTGGGYYLSQTELNFRCS